MELDQGQRDALNKVKRMFEGGNPNIMCLFGPPGSGKTVVLIEAILYAVKSSVSVTVACPTGRAAVNIAEALPPRLQASVGCMTIDRLINDIRYKRASVPAATKSKAIGLGGLLIIDEVGMMSKSHYQNLVVPGRGKGAGLKLILSGDCDQLPPPCSRPFYAHTAFLDEVRSGNVFLAELRGNHRNGECKQLQTLLEPFKSGRITVQCQLLLAEIARKRTPDFVWLYIAQRHKSLHAWNDRKAAEVAALGSVQVRVVPSKYPDRTITLSSGRGRVEGTRVLITENIYADGKIAAVNGESGIVSAVLCKSKRDGSGVFTLKDSDAFDVILDRTLEPVTICARRIQAPHNAEIENDDSIFEGPESGTECIYGSDSGADDTPTPVDPKRKKQAPQMMWVVDVALGYAGTIYTQQGRTIEKEILVVNWENMTTEALLVALSRVRSADQLRFDSFDLDMQVISRLMKVPNKTNDKLKLRELLRDVDTFVHNGIEKSAVRRQERVSSGARKRRCLGY